MALIPLNIILLFMNAGTIYLVVFLLQIAFYTVTLVGWMMAEAGRKNKFFYVPYYFMFMNMNVFRGISYLCSHKNSGTWEKAKRG